MPVPFAINGLGRVGRALLRIAAGRDDLLPVAANDLEPAAALAERVARDSVYGPFAGEVRVEPGAAAGAAAAMVVAARGRAARRLAVFSEPDPGRVPWQETGARVVVEATGVFLERTAAARHLRGGVERVLLTANATDADLTVCLGINEGDFDPARHRVVSNASCTTNCLAPLVRVLDERFGVRRAMMSTVHPYTLNQRLLDSPHPDRRRARAAALNIVPVTTTAPRALGGLMPGLAGRVEGLAIRVPTPAVAMLDLVAELAADADAEALRDAFRAAAAGPLAGIVAAVEDERVSSDFVGRPESAVVDLPLVAVADRRLARVIAWYDNEWGYASRLADLVARVGAAGGAAAGPVAHQGSS
jgi:glyceraldehyde 3-phosphate dehydrogenase